MFKGENKKVCKVFLNRYKAGINLLCIIIFFSINANFVHTKTFDVCIVKIERVGPYEVALRSFLKELEEKGYKEGSNLNLTFYNLKSDSEKKIDYITEIKSRKPDLIITFGTEATKIIVQKIRNVPVVFSMVLNPVESGLIKSIQHSGNNLTGCAMNISPKLQFKVLKEALPQAEKVGVVYDSRKTGDMIRKAMHSAKKMNLELVRISIASPREVPKAIRSLIDKVDVLWIIADTTVISKQSLQYMLTVALREKIPVIGYADHIVKAGALFSLSCDYEDIGRQSGELSSKILKGVKPNSLPIALPRKAHLVINLKVAETLGLNIPRSLLEKSNKIFK